MIFFGSSYYSRPILQALLAAGQHPLVVTTPNQPRGRGLKIQPNPLAQLAQEKGLTVLKLASLKKEKVTPAIRQQLSQHQLGLCAVYGKIIPNWLLETLSQGILNLHPSLLPQWRGASPAVGIILNGETQGGFSLIKMDAKLDHGPLLYQESWPLLGQLAAGEYYQIAFQKMAAKIANLVDKYRQGQLAPQPQDHRQATFTFRLQRQDGYLAPAFLQAALTGKTLPFQQLPPLAKKILLVKKPYPAGLIAFRLWRALYPWPGIWTFVKKDGQQQRLKILQATQVGRRFYPRQIQVAGGRPMATAGQLPG